MRAVFLFLSAFTLTLCCAPVTLAQVPPNSDTTSVPIPGAGHDYITGPVETVNPANGSISIRIPVIMAPGRGLSIPFSFTYDSNGANVLSGTANNLGWSGAGWSGTHPVMTLSQTNYTVPGVCIIGPCAPQNCGALVSCALQCLTGGLENLNLSVFGKTGANNGGDCSQGGYGWYSRGGEGSVLATTSPEPPQPGYNSLVLDPVTVTDGDGTVYSFPASGIIYSVMPTSIADRNGNAITLNAPDLPPSSAHGIIRHQDLLNS